MKSIYALLTFLLLSTTTISAQVQKGDISLLCQFPITHEWSEQEFGDGFSFGESFSFGYLVSDHVMLGLSVLDRFDLEGLSPQVRYFFNPESERNIYFADLITSYEFDDTAPRATFSLGFNRFVGENLSLEAAASYSTFSDEPDALRLGLGVRSFIGRDAWKDRSNAASRFGKGSYLLGFADFELGMQSEAFVAGLEISNGYFITDRFAIGLRDMLSFSRRDGIDLSDFRSWSHELAAFGRYYLQNSGRRITPFTELGVGFQDSRFTSNNNYDINSFRWLAEARFGFNVFVTPEMAFEFALVGRQESRSNLVQTYQDRTQFPEERFPDLDGTIEDRNFRLGLDIGVQFFIQQD